MHNEHVPAAASGREEELKTNYTDENIFEQIRQTVSAEELAERYLSLAFKEKGRRKWACCPVHSEKTGSLCLFPDGKMKCFGCGFSGDGVDLVAAGLGVNIKAAADMIANDYGLSRPQSKKERRSIARQIRERQEAKALAQRQEQEAADILRALLALRESLRIAAKEQIQKEEDLEKPEAVQLIEGIGTIHILIDLLLSNDEEAQQQAIKQFKEVI